MTHKGLCVIKPKHNQSIIQSKPASVAQLDACPTGDQEVAGSTPAEVWQHSFVEIDHEIFSSVILSLPKGSCQFLAKECAQYWLTA